MVTNGIKTALAAGLLLAVGTPLLGADDAPLKVQNKGAMTGASRIAIGAFNVGFIFESVDQTKATGGLMGAFGGATKAKSSLVGVTPAMMQQIADAAYADFTGQLQARGLVVADPAAVFGDPAMARAKGDAGPAEINITLEKGSKGKATFYKPAALPVQLMLAGDFLGSGMSSIGRNMQAGQNSAAVATFAKNTGTPVVDVVYLIDFSDQKRPGAFSFSGIKVNANLSVAANFSKMSVVGANGRQNSVMFAQPVAVEGDFIEIADATSGVGRATQTAANIAGGLAAVAGFGGLRFGKTREFTFTAKPGNYEGGAGKAASLANQQLVAQLVAQR